MLRAALVILAIFCLPLASLHAETPGGLEANAALKYWQAFATMPKLSDAEQNKLAEYLIKPLDAHVKEVLAQAEYSLQMMRDGAALPRCEWGTPYEEGINILLPHGSAARVLCNLACLRARLRFEEGKSKEAIDDLIAALIMGRHISFAGTNIMLLAGYALEHRVYETLAQELPRLDARMIRYVQARLAGLPAGTTPAAAMKSEERSFLDWFVRKVKEAKDKESLVALLAPLFISEEKGQKPDLQKKAREFLESSGGTADGVLKFAAETRMSYILVAKQLELPLAQFEKEFEREGKAQANNPVFQVFFPAMVNVRRAVARMEVRRALLSAALAVQLEGRDALKNHPDPVMGGPFEYSAFEGGFELRSKLKNRDDKPVVLTAGVRK
ncbi:MAG TPA: hypothetical protein VGZ47_12230 [Gemmataceae bacterium]|jgi:hypothetical protein|nr:hypothetical protein [Gemmataceae bacterium]